MISFIFDENKFFVVNIHLFKILIDAFSCLKSVQNCIQGSILSF